jgi:hypothetical protein
MTNIIIIFGLLSGLIGGLYYVYRKIMMTGQNEQKLNNAEKALENVKKANNVSSSDDHDDELRDKYGIK